MWRVTWSFLFGAVGGVVPLLSDSPPLSGLGSSEWGGAPHLAPETDLLALHLDVRGQHAGQERLPCFSFFNFVISAWTAGTVRLMPAEPLEIFLVFLICIVDMFQFMPLCRRPEVFTSSFSFSWTPYLKEYWPYGHCDLMKHVFGGNMRTQTFRMTKFHTNV